MMPIENHEFVVVHQLLIFTLYTVTPNIILNHSAISVNKNGIKTDIRAETKTKRKEKYRKLEATGDRISTPVKE